MVASQLGRESLFPYQILKDNQGAMIVRYPSFLNESIANHGDWVLPFYTSRFEDNGPSMLPIYSTRRA